MSLQKKKLKLEKKRLKLEVYSTRKTLRLNRFKAIWISGVVAIFLSLISFFAAYTAAEFENIASIEKIKTEKILKNKEIKIRKLEQQRIHLESFLNHAMSNDILSRIRLAHYIKTTTTNSTTREVWETFYGELVDECTRTHRLIARFNRVEDLKDLQISPVCGIGGTEAIVSPDEGLGEPIAISVAVRNRVDWLFSNYAKEIKDHTENNLLTGDLIAGLFALSSGYYIDILPEEMSSDEKLELMVGDTLDYPKRHAFPRDKESLISVAGGQEMFEISRDALEKVSKYEPTYRQILKNEDKFLRAFGPFGIDLSLFSTHQEFFLRQQWNDFDRSLEIIVPQLLNAARVVVGDRQTELTRDELAYVGIVWIQGRFDRDRGLKQGYRLGSGRYFGEILADVIDYSLSLRRQ